ncbi:outer membrane protein assembly factor BamA [Aurantivibrio infirmus]
MKQKYCLFVLLFCCSFFAYGQNDSAEFLVNDIRVEGLQRVSSGTVFAALPIAPGDVVSMRSIGMATRELFKTGLFDNIEIGREGGVLVVSLVELPAVSAITIEGNKAIKTDDLLSSMRDNGLSEGQIFKRATLEGLAQGLEREYVSRGRYGASVKTEVIKRPQNQVSLNVTVDEGKEARVRHVNIVGNSAFSDEELLDLFEMQSTGWLSWMNGNDKYSSEKLTGDIDRLESYYLDRGYLEFGINSAPVSISPDKRSVYITINIVEGESFKVKEINLAGDPILPEEEVRKLILLQKDKTFSQLLMTTSSEFITQRLGNEGYTFAETNGSTTLNREDKTVDVTFFIDPAKRAYVRRIEFKGNSYTSDEVLRREMTQMEAGSASTAHIENSKNRLLQTGYFKGVEVETTEVPGTDDQIDVEYSVEEQSTAGIQFQLGYSDAYKTVIGVDLTHNNWRGSGKQVSIGVNSNSFQKTANFSYVDPYFTADGVSRGFSVFYQERDFDEVGVSNFATNRLGGSISFGYPIAERERLNFSLGYSRINIEVGRFAVQEILGSPRLEEFVPRQYLTETDFLDTSGYAPVVFGDNDPALVASPEGFIDLHGDSFDNFTFSLGWLQRKLNRGVLATRGSEQRLTFELSIPGGDLEYYKFVYEGQYFKPLTENLTLRLRTKLGYAGAYGDTVDVPFFEHFFAGGFGSIRGFEKYSLGPRSTPAEIYNVSLVDLNNDGNITIDEQLYVLCENGSAATCATSPNGKLATNIPGRTDDPFGGNVLIEASAEVIFPLPFIKDQRDVQSAFFIDAGGVFDTECGELQLNCLDVGFDGLSASFGIGLTWINGFAPMTFSIAKPIQETIFDDTKFFQFTLGTAF